MTSSIITIEAGHGPNSTAPVPSYNTPSTHSVSASGSAAASDRSSSDNNTSNNSNSNSNNNDNNDKCPSSPTPGTGTANPTANNSTGTSGNTSAHTTTASTTTHLLGHENNIFHAHRQNHNSSKLPAFRFADLKKDALILPSLLQHMPPSPVSPNPAQNTADNEESLRDAKDLHLSNQHQHQHHLANRNNGQTITDRSVSHETQSSTTEISHQPKSQILRASTIPTPSAPTLLNTTTGSKRPASFPDSPRIVRTSSAIASQSASIVTPVAKRRLTTSATVEGAETSTSTDSVSKNSRAPEASNPAETSTKEWAQGQRQLLLPRTIDSANPDEKKKSRPPVSYRAPTVTGVAGGGRPVIPPIRSFRSSGSRKSLVLDMHTRRMSDESFSEDNITDSNQRDRTLRALEGREDDYSRVTPPDSADATTDNENTAEIFMNIAREEPAHRHLDEREMREDQSAISRITRASHRRPLSTTITTFQATSPPQLTRRLSDQRENFRSRNLADIQSTQKAARELTYARPSITTSEEPIRSQTLRTPLRPSPITPRHSSFQDDNNDGNPMYARRRSSVAETSVSNSASRVSQYRNANLAVGQGRTYNSSPLVPKSVEVQKQETQQGSDHGHGVEGTESSGSTAAPSTVWDELDDLKSRIHRLELTGKIPPTSGAAMSRASDDRPPTATTNATTMSASPKQRSGTGLAPGDATSIASSQRESQPLLYSALSKTKNLVSPEVFSAIESAATDALALSNMMGIPGQPGPISSGASTVGGGGSVTDRQLRRKADSICRSLTELCIALADEFSQPKQVQSSQSQQPAREAELTKSPTAKPANSSLQKRSVAFPDSAVSTTKLLTTSPRAPTSLEQRRMTMLATSNLSSPRFAAAPLTPLESGSAGRKSSMLLRTFRAGTDEPEEVTGRRSSLILRKRRAVTEEPEEPPQEGRKTSLLRTRRAMNEDEDDAGRLRTPSRAITEVNGFRTASRDVSTFGQTSPPDTSLGSSPLPRSRLIPTSFNSRLAGASTSSSSGLMQRRFLGRSTVAEREAGNSTAEKLTEDRSQRQLSLGQTALLNRTSSITTPRRRESGIPSLPNTQQGSGGNVYR